MRTYIRAEIARTAGILECMAADAGVITAIVVIAEACTAALKNDHQILLAGNGGSAADAQHLASELVGRLLFDRPALSALALTTDTAILTSISNDYGYEQIFVRQIEAIGRPGDVFVAISTSGCSKNLVLALKRAREKGLVTVGLLGGGSGEMGDWCDHHLNIPNRETQKIQEGHIVVGHILCTLIERAMYLV